MFKDRAHTTMSVRQILPGSLENIYALRDLFCDLLRGQKVNPASCQFYRQRYPLHQLADTADLIDIIVVRPERRLRITRDAHEEQECSVFLRPAAASRVI